MTVPSCMQEQTEHIPTCVLVSADKLLAMHVTTSTVATRQDNR